MTKKVEKAEIETSGLGIACVDVARRGFVRSDASLLLKGTQSCAGKNKAMKKLMFAAAVAACATVGLASDAGIVSANIVGYNTIEADATDGESVYPMLGLSFTPVSGDSAKLSDFKPVEGTFDTDSDNLQAIDPTSLEGTTFFAYCGTTKAEQLVAVRGGKAEDYIGWWDLFLGDIGDDAAKADDYPIKPGDGFLGSFLGGNKLQFTSSGEAPTKTTDYTTDGGASYYPIIANYIPKQITLGMIVPKDGTFDTDADNLQVIDPTSLEGTTFFAYCGTTKAEQLVADRGGKAEDYIGWWDLFLGDIGDDAAKADDYPVNPGDGFLGSFLSESAITFQFPSSLD